MKWIEKEIGSGIADENKPWWIFLTLSPFPLTDESSRRLVEMLNSGCNDP